MSKSLIFIESLTLFKKAFFLQRKGISEANLEVLSFVSSLCFL